MHQPYGLGGELRTFRNYPEPRADVCYHFWTADMDQISLCKAVATAFRLLTVDPSTAVEYVMAPLLPCRCYIPIQIFSHLYLNRANKKPLDVQTVAGHVLVLLVRKSYQRGPKFSKGFRQWINREGRNDRKHGVFQALN